MKSSALPDGNGAMDIGGFARWLAGGLTTGCVFDIAGMGSDFRSGASITRAVSFFGPGDADIAGTSPAAVATNAGTGAFANIGDGGGLNFGGSTGATNNAGESANGEAGSMIGNGSFGGWPRPGKIAGRETGDAGAAGLEIPTVVCGGETLAGGRNGSVERKASLFGSFTSAIGCSWGWPLAVIR